MKNARLLLIATTLLTFLVLGCNVYFKSNHYQQTNKTREGRTIVKKPQSVSIGEEQGKAPFFPESQYECDSGSVLPIVADTAVLVKARGLSTFDMYIDDLLKIEGGFQNDSNDLSNKSGVGTNYGITAETAHRFYYTHRFPNSKDMKALTRSRAILIYQKCFESYKLDSIVNPELAFFVFDGFVNMPSRMPKIIQHSLERQGIYYHSPIGPKHLWGDSLRALINSSDSKRLLKDLVEIRTDYYKYRVGELPSSNGNFDFLSQWNQRIQDKKYINGWINRVEFWKKKLQSK